MLSRLPRRWPRAVYAPGVIPVVGEVFTLGRYPAGGSRETPNEAGHGFVQRPFDVAFGAIARHVSDMADEDANWFTPWGGQDGWLGSAAFLDQVPLWLEGRAIRVPLCAATVLREFQCVTQLLP